MGTLGQIVKAYREGNVRLFTETLEKNAGEFIDTGTYLVIEKLKALVCRNLCKRVYGLLLAASPGSDAHKMDLAPFEEALRWQDDCDEAESSCVLSSLIYEGYIKGYMSFEHQK